MSALLLYGLPILARFSIADTFDVGSIFLSLLPLFVVLPTLKFQAWFSDERREHVARHAVYAFAFTVSSASSVRWDVIYDNRQDSWAQTLVAYLGIGSITLWWFCLSHMAENRLYETVRTHQGDVAVLPLTLFAIATFAFDVPDEAFRFSRSVIFFVPVVVAWATLHFIAFTNFACRQVTTYNETNFDTLAHSALVIASTLLTMIELNSSSFLFQFLPIVAAILCQVSYLENPLRRVSFRVRRRILPPLFAILLAFPAAWLWNLKGEEDTFWVLFGMLSVVHVLGVTCLPRLAGDRWVVPATLYSALLSFSFVALTPSFFDIVALTCLFYVSFSLLQWVTPSHKRAFWE